MNAVRLIARGGLTAAGAAVLVVLSSTLAWADPAPLEREPSRGGGGVSTGGTGGTSFWELAAVAAAGALLAALVIGVVMLLVSHQHATHRPAPTA